MATRSFHLGVEIDGLLSNYKRKKMNRLIKENGRYLTDQEARQQLAAAKAKGWKLLPTADCPDFDHFGGGCPGHENKPEQHEEKDAYTGSHRP